MRRIETGDGRFYQISTGGRVVMVPSVTSVLSAVLAKPWLINWAAREACAHIELSLPIGSVVRQPELASILKGAAQRHRAILRQTGEFGSALHAAVEHFLRDGKEPDLGGADRRLIRCFNTFRCWWPEQDLQVIDVEKVVYNLGPSSAGGYAGTLDCLAVTKHGDYALLDLKSSSRFSEEMALQAVAYKMALADMAGVEARELMVVRVGREDARLQVVRIPPERHDDLFEVFVAVRRIFDWKLDRRLVGCSC
jgi:CRISPR/Cas system-associated exonuclease Cas4 (RecB family)